MANLLRISEASSLALHTMAVLARNPDRHLSNGELAAMLRASEHTLAKVLQQLVRSGLVESSRGPSGGFALLRSPEDVTLWEVFEAIEGPLRLSGCLLGTSLCGGRECVLGELVNSVNQQVMKVLFETSLAQLAASMRLCPTEELPPRPALTAAEGPTPGPSPS